MKKNARIEAVERTTGRSWEDWLQFMDKINAKDLTHHEIASILLEELDGMVDNIGWWAQSTTNAYEQYIGRRIPGQRPDGTFQTSVSKATNLGMEDLMEKWKAFASKDDDVQAIIAQEAKSSGTEKRITWRSKAQDGSDIRITSEPKKNGTASIIAQLMGLESHDLNMEAKEKWTAILERFLETL